MLEPGIESLIQEFNGIVEALSLSLKADSDDESEQLLIVMDAFRQNVQIMQRLDSDAKNNNEHEISVEEVTEIADFALNLLDEVANACASRGLQNEMIQVHRLSLPVVIWLKQYQGALKKMDIVVNAIASYANTLQDAESLQALCILIGNVVDVTDVLIKQDLEANNAMRPWRVLNLNWGIVATRTHNVELMEQVFDQLINNIPDDVQQFFNEGMQQMDIVGYPKPVRSVMEKYASGVGSSNSIH